MTEPTIEHLTEPAADPREPAAPDQTQAAEDPTAPPPPAEGDEYY